MTTPDSIGGSAWQPIETAPPGHGPCLVWAISEPEWDDAEDEERPGIFSQMVAVHSRIQPGTWWLSGGSCVLVKHPTHWMPLPAPPESDQ